MTEKEKAAQGELYNANYDKELVKERVKCKKLCRKYNLLEVDDERGKAEVLGKLIGKKGSNCYIEQPFYCDYGYNIEVGDNFYSNHNLVILDCAKVKIGNNVFIAPNCGIYTAGHPIDAYIRNQGLEYAKSITIGNDVWIGGGVQILPGVKIGNNCVIGAGSVVNKDIPDGVVAAGNPCRVIKNNS